jgi:hypothetical protein
VIVMQRTKHTLAILQLTTVDYSLHLPYCIAPHFTIFYILLHLANLRTESLTPTLIGGF